MKSRPRAQRSNKLAARLNDDKENICQGWQLERVVAARLGHASATAPRNNIIQGYRQQTKTLTHGHSGETLARAAHHMKKPSV